SDILHIENNFGITLVNDPEHCCYIGKQVVRSFLNHAIENSRRLIKSILIEISFTQQSQSSSPCNASLDRTGPLKNIRRKLKIAFDLSIYFILRCSRLAGYLTLT